jgi:hypothetical protein
VDIKIGALKFKNGHLDCLKETWARLLPLLDEQIVQDEKPAPGCLCKTHWVHPVRQRVCKFQAPLYLSFAFNFHSKSRAKFLSVANPVASKWFPLLVLVNLLILWRDAKGQGHKPGTSYFVSNWGNNRNPGSRDKPWKTLEPIRNLHLGPGDSISLQGGVPVVGSLWFANGLKGTSIHPIVVCSYGKGQAIIEAGNQTAITLNKGQFMVIKNLILKGAGRNRGNTGKGIWLIEAQHVLIDQIDVSGFQKSGIDLTDCSDSRVEHVSAHENGFAGIAVQGSQFPKYSNRGIYIGYCNTYDNPGDPSELNNQSGNGIVVSMSREVLIEYCVATGNGWDMPRKGNGPVGIWAWESDSVIIQHCISFRNRTSPGSMDGGGFDLDGGVTHSTVQYNLSYENEGYGFGIFQFAGATAWHHNTFRYNISYNDGNVTQNGASVLWWNGSKDSLQFHDCFFYNNLLYNLNGYTLGVIPGERDNAGFVFFNNIFVAKDEQMVGGKIREEAFIADDWWSLSTGFKVNGINNFEAWVNQTGKEKWMGKMIGLNVDPKLINPKPPEISNPQELQLLVGFQLMPNSDLQAKGLSASQLLGQIGPLKDFFGQDVPSFSACEPGISQIIRNR